MSILTIPHTAERRERTTLFDAVRRWQPSPRVATAAILGTSIAYASTSIFVRKLTESGMSVVAVAFFRFALAAVVLAKFLSFASEKRAATIWGLASGVVMGAGWIIYVRTIDTAALAVAGVVQMTFPCFALAVGWLLFGVRPTIRAMTSAGLVVVAAVIGLGAGSSAGLSPVLFVAPATFGFSIAVLTERLGPLDPFERLASVAVGASVAIAPLLLTLSPGEALPTSFGSVGWMLGIAVVSSLVPMTIYAAAAPTIGTARTTASGAFELPTVFLIGSLFFHEQITSGHLASALIIAGAIAISLPAVRQLNRLS